MKPSSNKNIFSRLINASFLLSSSLEIREILPQAMDMMKTLMRCEAASIMLLDKNTNELTFEVALGEKGEAVKKKTLPLGKGIGGTVALTGKPLIVNDAYKDKLFDSSFDKYSGFKTKAILCVPLKIQERIIGIAQAINPAGRKKFTREDLYIFSIFTNQVSLAIESARLHKQILTQRRLEDELKFAKSIQESFLPSSFPEGGNFSIHGIMSPARKVGGDFYDVFKLDAGRIGLAIGDVSGKGVAAAIFMSRIMSELRFFSQYSDYSDNPSLILEALNHSLFERFSSGVFVTVVYAIFQPQDNKLTIANAGHINPIVFSSQMKKADFLECPGGFPLGVEKEQKYPHREIILNKEDCFLMFTDGLVEARNSKGDFFPETPLLEPAKYNGPQATDIVEGIVKEIKVFSGRQEQFDDLTILALKL